jgi:hypothetical protein
MNHPQKPWGEENGIKTTLKKSILFSIPIFSQQKIIGVSLNGFMCIFL